MSKKRTVNSELRTVHKKANSEQRTANSEKQQKQRANRLTHVNKNGKLRMVAVTNKRVTKRHAIARAEVVMAPNTLEMIRANRIAKGDVLSTAQIAGIVAAKRTDELIPLCHTLPLTDVHVEFQFVDHKLVVEARVDNVGRTGPELEAIMAASIAAVTIYDMCKAVDRGIRITNTCLLEKSGGKSGAWRHEAKRTGR